MVVVVALLVSLSIKFENTASDMYLGGRFQVCKPTLQLQAEHRALSLTDHSFTTFQSIIVKKRASAAIDKAHQYHASITKAHTTCTIFKFN